MPLVTPVVMEVPWHGWSVESPSTVNGCKQETMQRKVLVPTLPGS